MEQDWLLLNINDGVASVTFNRPEVKNAMTADMSAAMAEFLMTVDKNPDVYCVVLRGNGGSFVSGGDVEGFSKTLDLSPVERQVNFERRVQATLTVCNALNRVSKPVVAVVEGSVAGAGIGYALAADYILAADSAKFVFAHAHIGISLDVALSYYLPRSVGLVRAKQIAMLGKAVSAQEALDIGMITQLASEDTLEDDIQVVLKTFKKMPPKAMAGIKQQLDASFTNDLASQVALEAQLVGACVTDDAFVQRVSAFVKK